MLISIITKIKLNGKYWQELRIRQIIFRFKVLEKTSIRRNILPKWKREKKRKYNNNNNNNCGDKTTC